MEALGHYQGAAELAGERALPHIHVGGMLVRLGRAKDALAAYERALAHDPDNLDALGGRAAALLATGRRADAAEIQARIIELRRARANASALTAPAARATPVSSVDTLMIAGERARAAGDTGAAIDAWLAESREHARAGHLDAALESCMRALSLDSGAVTVHLELCRLYFERDWRDQAVDRVLLLRRLLALEPNPQGSADLAEIVAQHAPDERRLAGEAGLDTRQPADG